jgi:hypothetical protein
MVRVVVAVRLPVCGSGHQSTEARRASQTTEWSSRGGCPGEAGLSRACEVHVLGRPNGLKKRSTCPGIGLHAPRFPRNYI